MDHIDYEELREILARINGWIENCDSKVSIILSGMGVFAGILFATDYVAKFADILQFMAEAKTIWSAVYLAVWAISLSLLIYGFICLIYALIARINTAEFARRGIKQDSLIFFSNIAQNSDLSAYCEKLKNYNSDQMEDDIISQIYICALICTKKFSLYKKGLIFSLLGVGVFMIMVTIGTLVT